MATTKDSNGSDTSIIRPGNSGGVEALQRVGFGTIESVNARETQGAALAERAKAEVQARWIMALQRPRNVEQFRVRLLEHCRRPRFAALAEYAKPVGRDKVRGPTIRFIETALQEFGNNLPVATIVLDDFEKRIVQVSVTDLERNITYYDDAIAEKTVEKRNPKDGDEVLGQRLNSYGDVVYRVRATEDDFVNKIASAVSKKTRNLGRRILPPDIVEEALAVCRKTCADADARDPAAARRELADYFAQLRVMPADLDAYLGHSFDQASPAELDELRGAYMTVRDGEAKWVDIVESAKVARGEIDKDKTSASVQAVGEKLQKSIANVKEKQKAKIAEAKAKAGGSAPAAQTTMPGAAPAMTDEERREIERAEREGR